MSSDDREQRLIAYCLKKGYVSVDKVKDFLDTKSKGKNVILSIAKELGWTKEQTLEMLRQASSSSNDNASTDSGRETAGSTAVSPSVPVITKETQFEKLTFGKYILVSKIGAGGMGVVYKAYHPELESEFAIKTILPRETGSSAIKRFMREAQISSQLKHPNIVRVYDVGTQDEQHYIVMDYIDGKDLSKIIKEESMGTQESFKTMLKIVHALQYAHEKSIIHRDIKPSNILIANDSERTPYLMDFGLASVVDKDTRLTYSGQMLGTPQYMSPEQAEGKAKQLDARSDIYSLGAVLYELITGKPVVRGKNNAILISKVILEEPVLPSRRKSSIPKDMETIVMKCLEKDPGRRYQSAGELAEDMERYIHGETVLARSPSSFYRYWRMVRRNWKYASIITALILLLIGVGSYSVFKSPGNKIEIESFRLLQEAERLEKNGNLKGANNLYLSIINTLDKNNINAKKGIEKIDKALEDKVRKASQLTGQSDLEGALKLYLEILDINEQHKEAGEAIRNQAQRSEETGDLLRARDLYKRLNDRNRNSPEFEGKIKDLDIKIQDEWERLSSPETNIDKRLLICRKLIGWYPKHTPEHTKALELYKEIMEERTKRYKEAREFYDRAMELFWNPELNETELIRCKNLFRIATEKDEHFADAHFQLGRASQRLLNTTDAIKYYKESLRHSDLTAPKYYLTALELPMIIHESRSPKRNQILIETLEKKFCDLWGKNSELKSSKDPYALLARAQLSLAKLQALEDISQKGYEETWKECMGYCDAVINNYPTFSDAYFIRAQLFSYLMETTPDSSPVICITSKPINLDQALKDCAQGLYLDPFRMEGYSLRGSIYTSIGAYEFAEKEYTKALLLKSVTKPIYYQNRAACYIAMRKPKLALDDLNKHIELTAKDFSNSKVHDDYQQAQAFLWRAVLNACCGGKDPEKDLSMYLAKRPSVSEKDDELIKTLIYLHLDDDLGRAEKSFKEFLKTNKPLLKPLQLLLISQGFSSNEDIDALSLAIEEIPNFFCVSPNLKRLKPKIALFSSLITNVKHRLLQEATNNPYENFSIVLRAYLELLNKNPKGREKYKIINILPRQECPPLTTDLFVYTIDYLSTQKRVQKLRMMKELPCASLYYRRAVDYYMNNEFEQARDDLESALDMSPNLMEAHYGLSTIYSVLSMKSDVAKASSYRELAAYHLKLAVVLGWKHIKDYTMKDEEFQTLGIGKDISLKQIELCEKEWDETEARLTELKNEVEELLSRGKTIRALRLLYETQSDDSLNELTSQTEEKVMEFFLLKLKNKEKEPDIDRKVELLFGERGKTKWEWAKRRYKEGKKF